MRRLALSLYASLALATSALAADLGVTYPSEAALLLVASHVPDLTKDGALVSGGYTADGIGYAITPAFPIQEPTGETTTDPFGNVVPVMRTTGWFRMLRWNGDASLLASRVVAAGGTMSRDAQTGAITIHAGPVTLTSPPPANPPVTF